MALGLPCVTLDCPSGPAEIAAQGQAAQLLPADADAPALAQALEKLMGDPKQRRDLGNAARASVRRRRSEEHTSELQSRGQLVCRHLIETKKYEANGKTLDTDKK